MYRDEKNTTTPPEVVIGAVALELGLDVDAKDTLTKIRNLAKDHASVCEGILSRSRADRGLFGTSPYSHVSETDKTQFEDRNSLSSAKELRLQKGDVVLVVYKSLFGVMSGSPLKPDDLEITLQVVTDTESEVKRPRLIALARKLFNCDVSDGKVKSSLSGMNRSYLWPEKRMVLCKLGKVDPDVLKRMQDEVRQRESKY